MKCKLNYFPDIVESNAGHQVCESWTDVSELNYWARKIGFQVASPMSYRLYEAGRITDDDIFTEFLIFLSKHYKDEK